MFGHKGVALQYSVQISQLHTLLGQNLNQRRRLMSTRAVNKVLIVAVISLLTAAAAADSQAAPRNLFNILGNHQSSDISPDALSADVEVDFSLLKKAWVKKLKLDFPDGASHIVVRERIETRSKTAFTWYGKVEGHPESTIFTVSANFLVGLIPTPNGLYRVRAIRGGPHRIFKMATRRFPNEGQPLSSVQGALAKPRGSDFSVKDSANSIRVMVGYTSAAQNASADIVTDIQHMIDTTNTIYENSGITTRLIRSGGFKTTYTETGNSDTDLRRMTDTDDGYLDKVPQFRQDQHADVVVMVIASAADCGRAWQMESGDNTHDFWPNAYAVVRLDCGLSMYSLAHEVGHVMGCGHDPDNETMQPVFDYSYGYQHPSDNAADSWRTVMAYQCSDVDCPRIQYFSNPKLTYGGDPIGIPNQTANKRTINNTDSIVANFLTGD
jgi:peptidyl-Asp metalloendopeptidase